MRDHFEEMIEQVNACHADPGAKGYGSTCEAADTIASDTRIRFEIQQIYSLDNDAFNAASTRSGLNAIMNFMETVHPEPKAAMNHIFTQPAPPSDTWSGNYRGAYVPNTTLRSFVWNRSSMGSADPANWTDLINRLVHEHGHAVGLHHAYGGAERLQMSHYGFLDDVSGLVQDQP